MNASCFMGHRNMTPAALQWLMGNPLQLRYRFRMTLQLNSLVKLNAGAAS
jgi:hypothetical protein